MEHARTLSNETSDRRGVPATSRVTGAVTRTDEAGSVGTRRDRGRNNVNASIRPWLGLLAALLLAGCGGSDGTANPVAPVPPPDDPPASGVTVSGVAATGAALDGATVTVRGPDGNLLDLGDVVTGDDGSYQVDLPVDTPLPVLVIVTPPDGEPVRTLIPAAEDGASSLVANVNPMTELVTDELVGAPDEDPASVATALAPVAQDPGVVAGTGQEVVGSLFGNDVSYASFADDPDFTAAGGGDTPSVADTLLDTLADVAADEEKPLSTFLAEQRSEEDPPRLLEQPGFQVKLVGQLVAKGNDPAELASKLDAAGALGSLPDGETTDGFRAAIDAVPAIIAATDAATTSLDGNAELKAAAAKAAVDTLANLITERARRFGDPESALAEALNSEAVRNTVSDVVTSVVTPLLERVAAREDGGTGVAGALDGVLRKTAAAAGRTLSAFSPRQLATTDVTELASAHLNQNVLDPATADQLDAIADGTASTADFVTGDDDVSETNQKLKELTNNDPSLIDGDADSVLEDPPGAWNVDDWNRFDWS
jgi:hypothetical protein